MSDTPRSRTEAIMQMVRGLNGLMAYNAKSACEKVEQEVAALETDLMQHAATVADLEQRFAKASSWIPVSERLPFLRAYVWAWETAGALHCTIAQYRGSSGWYGPWDEQITVTHWMPLPEAPK